MLHRLGKWLLGITTTIGLLCATTGYAREIVLTPTNALVLRGEVASDNMNALIHSIMTSKEDRLYLYIDSFGGSIFAGLKLIEAIKSTDKTIVCIANTAISMAFVILQSCDERLVVDDAVLMQHVASYGMEGQEPNNFTFAGFLHRVTKDLYKRQAERIGMAEEEFYKKIRDDWWLWDDEAVKANAADGKVLVKCSSELTKIYYTETIQVLFLSVELKFNACPLIPGPIVSSVPKELKKSPDAIAALTKVLEKFNPRAMVERRFMVRRDELQMLQP